MDEQSPFLAELAESLVERTRRAVAKPALDVALPLIVQLSIDAKIADYAGVTQRVGDGEFETSGPTDPLVRTLDEYQYEFGEGPCVEAAYVGGILASRNVATDERWLRWGPKAADLGVVSVMSIQLFTQNDAMGALNLYSTEEREYSPQDRDLGHLIAAHTSIALAHFRGEEHLWKAIDSRHIIGVAQGILMQKFGLSLDESFSLLHRYSQQRNVKLRVLAGEVVESGALP